MDLLTIVTTIIWLATAVVPLSELISTYITKAGGTWARIQSWVVAFLLPFAAQYFGLTNMFVDMGWILRLVSGLLIGLTANGIFQWSWIKTVLETIKFRIPKQA